MVQRRAVVFVAVVAAALALAVGLVSFARVSPLVAFVGLVFLALLLWLAPSLDQIKEFERGVVFRFGKFHRVLPAGLYVYFPSFETVTHVDVRERPVDISEVQIVTKDNVNVKIDTIVLVKVVDAKKSVVEIKNFEKAIADVVISELRTIVGKFGFEDLLEKTEDVNILVRQRLVPFEERWGISVTRVEIQNLTLPPVLLDSMTRKKAAEEFKVRVKTEAEARQVALEILNTAASKLDGNTISYLYLDTLKKMAEGKSTKFVLPAELSELAKALGAKLKFG